MAGSAGLTGPPQPPARGDEVASSAAQGATVEPGRGRYKIFLGMAAGVGKTYRMLQEGQAEAEAGHDVVIGYLEPHGRAETLAQAAGLETLPRRRVSYRDTVLEEMDLPGILARAAGAVLDRRARAHQRARRRAREALRGHRGRARGRHRRLLDRQRSAPGEPQRPGRGADRNPGQGNRARFGPRCG